MRLPATTALTIAAGIGLIGALTVGSSLAGSATAASPNALVQPSTSTPAAAAATPSPGQPRTPLRDTDTGCTDETFYWNQPGCLPAHAIPLEEVIPGGPPPDGIPPIDDPVYESMDDAAAWLVNDSPVMVVDIAGDVRAYPLAILTWHEIVNDTVGGVPVTVTYCPLCNSALVFDRRVTTTDGELVLDFGTSGRLYQSNLVMWDRQSRSLWTQFEGEAVIGERFLGTQLSRVPAWLFGFGELTTLHPDAQVLSRDTGFTRAYGRNPYVQYDTPGADPFLFRGDLDPRFPPMTRVVGLADGDEATAVLLDELAEVGSIEVSLQGQPIVVVWAPGQASALERQDIDDGRDVGQTAAFRAELDGMPVQLEPTDTPGRFVDVRSGSTFDLRGRALDGPLEGQALTAVAHDDSFWFVWVAFRPDTDIADAPATGNATATGNAGS